MLTAACGAVLETPCFCMCVNFSVLSRTLTGEGVICAVLLVFDVRAYLSCWLGIGDCPARGVVP